MGCPQVHHQHHCRCRRNHHHRYELLAAKAAALNVTLPGQNTGLTIFFDNFLSLTDTEANQTNDLKYKVPQKLYDCCIGLALLSLEKYLSS